MDAWSIQADLPAAEEIRVRHEGELHKRLVLVDDRRQGFGGGTMISHNSGLGDCIRPDGRGERGEGEHDDGKSSARYFDPDMAHFLAITPWPYSGLYHETKDSIAVTDYSKYNLIEPIIKPHAMTLREIDEAIIRCYRDFYMPKMAAFRKFPDEFRRRYMLSSMKLIMKSSFIVQKLGRLGMPAAMQKILAAAEKK